MSDNGIYADHFNQRNDHRQIDHYENERHPSVNLLTGLPSSSATCGQRCAHQNEQMLKFFAQQQVMSDTIRIAKANKRRLQQLRSDVMVDAKGYKDGCTELKSWCDDERAYLAELANELDKTLKYIAEKAILPGYSLDMGLQVMDVVQKWQSFMVPKAAGNLSEYIKFLNLHRHARASEMHNRCYQQMTPRMVALQNGTTDVESPMTPMMLSPQSQATSSLSSPVQVCQIPTSQAMHPVTYTPATPQQLEETQYSHFTTQQIPQTQYTLPADVQKDTANASNASMITYMEYGNETVNEPEPGSASYHEEDSNSTLAPAPALEPSTENNNDQLYTSQPANMAYLNEAMFTIADPYSTSMSEYGDFAPFLLEDSESSYMLAANHFGEQIASDAFSNTQMI